MSKTNAIKTFRDLLSFLTIIPLATTEDFMVTSASHMYLFPVVGALIGLFAAGYFQAILFAITHILLFLASLIWFLPQAFLLRLFPAGMTLAFLLVLTGLQHFDGLVDLGNAIGLNRLEERTAIVHAWTVTHKGAFLAIAVEFAAFLGFFFLNSNLAYKAIIVAEISAKLAMVTIAWIGKPAHKGLGSRFVKAVRLKKRMALAYLLSALIVIPLLGLTGIWIIMLSALCGIVMERVGHYVFGGVPGDLIGATNEVARAATLVVLGVVFLL